MFKGEAFSNLQGNLRESLQDIIRTQEDTCDLQRHKTPDNEQRCYKTKARLTSNSFAL